MEHKEKIDRVYYKRDKLNQIRGFCAVYQNDSSTIKASKETGLEPATLRNQIRALEEQLKVDLFIRTANNRLIPTEAGKAFYAKAIEMVNSFDGLLKNFLEDFQEEKNNEIKIAAHFLTLSEILPKYIKILKDKPNFKNIKVKLINIGRQEALNRLRNGEIDIAIYPIVQGEKLSMEFNVDRLYKHRDFIVFPKNHPLANKEIEIEDFKKYPYFLMDKFSFYDPRVAIEFGETDIDVENSTWEIIFGLLKYDLGITGMTNEVFDRYRDSDKLFIKKDISHFFPDIYYSLIGKKNFKNKLAIDFMVGEIKKNYGFE